MAPRACQLCCECFKWTPVVFIASIAGWSYYAYVVQMCILTVDSIFEKIIFLLLYHPIFILFLWSYWQTIFSKPITPPKEFYLTQPEWTRLEGEKNENVQREQLDHFAARLPIQNRTIAGFPRYCEKCKCVKPDRCHHCSVCSKCVLKMDHHCPWVNNCVGFHNYKYFVLFLGYALLYCLYIALSSLKYFIAFWSRTAANSDPSDVNPATNVTSNVTSDLQTDRSGVGRFHILFLFFVSVMFGISLVSLFGYHIYLTCNNRSTLEAFRAPVFQTGQDKDGFSLGWRANINEVFGDKPSRWILPVHTAHGDGVSYASRLQPTVNYNTMGNTPSHSGRHHLGDGVTYPTRTVDLDSDGLLGQRQRWMEEGDNNEGSYDNRMVDMA